MFYLLSGLLAVVIDFLICFGRSKLDKDPSMGGAYFAMFFFSSPIAFILGIFVYHVLVT